MPHPSRLEPVRPNALAPLVAIGAALAACSEPPAPRGCTGAGTDAATAGCLTPTQPPEHYVSEALRYFDTLDTSAPADSVPRYAETVARWEWPPWLLLTGFGRDIMTDTASVLRARDPSTVPVRDCRFFPAQPFARCYVTFEYGGGKCPIYEEFTFNDAGETTFIEAWSDVNGLRPTTDADRWGEREGFPRLSTRVPGLGSPDGYLDVYGAPLTTAAATDADLAELQRRAQSFWGTWFAEVQSAPADFFAKGCGW